MVSNRDRLAFCCFISGVMNGLSGVALHVIVLSGACLSSSCVMMDLKVDR